MARPSDPAKLSALRARQAANSRAYRARKAAEREGLNPPAPTVPKLGSKRVPKPADASASEAAVARAHRARTEARARRHEVIGKLPSVRNPAAPVWTPREPATAPATMPPTEPQRRQRIRVLRDNIRAERLETLGRSRKAMLLAELDSGPQADRLTQTMSREQQARFRAAATRIASISNQALGILFRYEQGQNDYNSVIERILASPESTDVEDGLDKLEELADLADLAGTAYAPKAIGRIRV